MTEKGQRNAAVQVSMKGDANQFNASIHLSVRVPHPSRSHIVLRRFGRQH